MRSKTPTALQGGGGVNNHLPAGGGGLPNNPTPFSRNDSSRASLGGGGSNNHQNGGGYMYNQMVDQMQAMYHHGANQYHQQVQARYHFGFANAKRGFFCASGEPNSSPRFGPILGQIYA